MSEVDVEVSESLLDKLVELEQVEQPKQKVKEFVKDSKPKLVEVVRLTGIRNGIVLVRYNGKLFNVSADKLDLSDTRVKTFKISEDLLKDEQ